MAGSASGQDEANPVFKMGQPCPLGISRFVPAKAKFFGVISWPYKKSFIGQACFVKMASFVFFFLRFYGNELGQHPAILTLRLVNNAHIMAAKLSF